MAEPGESSEEFFDILDNKQLLKKVLKEGDKNVPRPERGCKVTLNLKTKLKEDGKYVESHCVDGLEIFVGDYDTIHGIDLVVPLMHIGEVSQVIIAPRFGYGSKGFEPDIPGDTTLDCCVELLNSEYMDEDNELSIEDRIRFGSAKKNRGNFWHSREEFSIAGQCYKRALDFLDVKEEEMKDYSGDAPPSDPVSQLIDLKATTYNNLAAVHIKSEAYDAALSAVNSSLMLNEKNVKALFRKAKILGIMGELQEGIEVLQAALKLEPDAKVIQAEMSRFIIKRREQLAKEKNMYKRMLKLDKPTQPKACFKQKCWKWGLAAAGTATATAVLSVAAYHIFQ